MGLLLVVVSFSTAGAAGPLTLALLGVVSAKARSAGDAVDDASLISSPDFVARSARLGSSPPPVPPDERDWEFAFSLLG